MPVSFFNSLPNDEYPNLLIVAIFSNKTFSGKTALPVTNLYFLTFPDDIAKRLAFCQSKFY